MTREISFGLVEAENYVGIMEIIDTMLKTAEVKLIRFDKIGGGIVLACVQGELGATAVAVDAARSLASKHEIKLRTLLLPHPDPILADFLSGPREKEG